ncbi:MAG: hypothetical protein JRI62_04920 [Deltaproteobacteria bacterium]|nr:hypothetical protein [Deltaproteobacteria bacterium]
MSELSNEKVQLNDGKKNMNKMGKKKLIRIGGIKKYEIRGMGQIMR